VEERRDKSPGVWTVRKGEKEGKASIPTRLRVSQVEGKAPNASLGKPMEMRQHQREGDFFKCLCKNRGGKLLAFGKSWNPVDSEVCEFGQKGRNCAFRGKGREGTRVSTERKKLWPCCSRPHIRGRSSMISRKRGRPRRFPEEAVSKEVWGIKGKRGRDDHLLGRNGDRSFRSLGKRGLAGLRSPRGKGKQTQAFGVGSMPSTSV